MADTSDAWSRTAVPGHAGGKHVKTIRVLGITHQRTAPRRSSDFVISTQRPWTSRQHVQYSAVFASPLLRALPSVSQNCTKCERAQRAHRLTKRSRRGRKRRSGYSLRPSNSFQCRRRRGIWPRTKRTERQLPSSEHLERAHTSVYVMRTNSLQLK